ncbi:hypothetical protein HYU15_02620 [Candidatus Woesearchaeota archaeon]|nr:hypothetical protein [Candidatus Woesearchaeota archaeon]
MVPKSRLDYVEFYAEKLKNDNRHFAQQKLLIDSQLKASSELFGKMFSGNFKVKARSYLRNIGLL